MPVSSRKIERGIAVRQRVSIEAPFGAEELAATERSFATFSSSFDDDEAQARAILRKLGYPDELGPYVVEPDGRWRLRDSRELSRSGLAYVRHPALTAGKELSPEWRAASILVAVRHLKAALEGSDAMAAARFGRELGMLIAEAVYVQTWEADALAGRESRRGGAKGQAERRAASTIEARNAALDQEDREIAERRPHLTAEARHQVLATKRGMTRAAVAKALARYRKKAATVGANVSKS